MPPKKPAEIYPIIPSALSEKMTNVGRIIPTRTFAPEVEVVKGLLAFPQKIVET
jgi:hypothetical protein